MKDVWWSRDVVEVDFYDKLWGVEATVSDDPEVGITVDVRHGQPRAGDTPITLGEQDVLDILVAMQQVRRGRR